MAVVEQAGLGVGVRYFQGYGAVAVLHGPILEFFQGLAAHAVAARGGRAIRYDRPGVAEAATVTEADGWGERTAALELVEAVRGKRRITLGADKGYDTHDFVGELRERNVTPHVTQNISGRRSAIDGRTTRHPGYAVSQVRRKRVEEIFGWVKATAGKAKTRFRGIRRVAADFLSTMTAYNLIRIARLEPAAA